MKAKTLIKVSSFIYLFGKILYKLYYIKYVFRYFAGQKRLIPPVSSGSAPGLQDEVPGKPSEEATLIRCSNHFS